MIAVNGIHIISPTEGENRIIDLNAKNTFDICAICGIISLYITSYGHMLKSKKSISLYSSFILDTKRRISNYQLKCSYDEADALDGIIKVINYLENDISLYPDMINIRKLSLFMDSNNDNSGLSDFYVPFLGIINRSEDIQQSVVKTIYPSIDGDKLFVFLHEVPAIFTNSPLYTVPEIPYLKFVLSFRFGSDNKISVYTLISFFNLFRINYIPDIKDNMGLGIYDFTVFDLFGGKYVNEKFDIENLRIIYYKLFLVMFEDNNINLNTIEQSLEDETIQFFNINLKSFLSLDPELHDIGVEALGDNEEEEVKKEDPPEDKKKEDPPVEEDPPAEDTEEEDPPTEEAPEEDPPAEEDTTEPEATEEAPAPVVQEDKPSPINFKLELGGEEETIDDLIYKKYAYNHIRNLLKQDMDTKVSSLMKIINNQWLFLLNTKTIKKLIKNLEKIITNKEITNGKE